MHRRSGKPMAPVGLAEIPPRVSCPLCGSALRPGEDLVVVDARVFHPTCVESFATASSSR